MVHSPASLSLEMGHSYTLRATSVDRRYAVDEVRGTQERYGKSCWAEGDRCWQLR
jgi:hypothetical protein